MRELFRRQPKFRPGSGDRHRAQVPDDLWRKCPGCGELIYNRELDRSMQVCPRCEHHFRLSARDRIALMADEDGFAEWDADLRTADPLGFRVGSETYLDKAKATMDRSGVAESVISGQILIDGRSFAAVVTDFSFFGASMGSVYGEKLVRAADRERDLEIPLLTVSSSGGARMQEGMLSLMQMAKTSAALSELAEARLPHISLMVDPCYGGVTASYAAIADVVLAEPGAKIGLTGPRVIEQVTRQKLPEGFQTAEFLLDHGLIDRVVPRSEIRHILPLLHDMYAGAPTVPSFQSGETGISPNGGRP
ncbi:MAG: acetyl-CoA carboxylase, carboxyltransferase subunit beta [Chloroflexota bacterium]